MMDLNALRIFVSVVQAGSLTQASERLNLSIATISRKITELEKALNRQLFDRSKTGVKPTTQGQQLYEQVRLDIDNLLTTERNLTRNDSQISGVLRISCIIGFDELWDMLSAFQQAHPKVQVLCQASDRIVDLVADGIDVAFRTQNLHTDNVIARPVFNTRAIWVASPLFLEKWGTPNKFEQLATYPLAGFTRLGQSQLLFETDSETFNLPFQFGSNDNHAVLHFALTHQAIVQISEYSAKKYLETGELVQVLSDSPSKSYQTYMIYLSHRHQSAVVKAFVDFVKEIGLGNIKP